MHVTCLIEVSSVIMVSLRGGGGGEVRNTPSLTTGSEVGSEIMIVGHNIFS